MRLKVDKVILLKSKFVKMYFQMTWQAANVKPTPSRICSALGSIWNEQLKKIFDNLLRNPDTPIRTKHLDRGVRQANIGALHRNFRPFQRQAKSEGNEIILRSEMNKK